MANLFNDTTIKIEKRAGSEIQLSDNADQWQQEIASSLYQQAPYVSNYATDVVLDKVDAERGYAYGKATIKNKFDIPQPQADKRSLNVPIIVKDRMLKPFDMYSMDNKSYPLSEQRMSQALFTAPPIELSDRKPGDKSISDQMAPPSRSHLNASVSTGGFGKYASLLDSISHTISSKERQAFLQKVANDNGLKNAYLTNDAFRKGVNKIASVPNQPPVADRVIPSATQFMKIAMDTFVIKMANVNAYQPTELEVDVKDVASVLGDDAYRMEEGETKNYSSYGELPTSSPSPMSQATMGTYKVQDSMGNNVFGNVLPMTSFDGSPTGESLFVNNNSFSVQEKIAGIKLGSEVELQETLPSGYGTFYSPDTNTVTEPMKVNYSSPAQNGANNHHGVDRLGNPIKVVRHPLVTKMAHIGGNSYAIPDTAKWISLPDKEISIKEDTSSNVKLAEFHNLPTTIEIRRNGDQYTFTGRPVEKLANSDTQFISKADAEFLLTVMGVGSDKIAELKKKTYIKVAGARAIIPLHSVMEEATKVATKTVNNFNWSLRRDLIKEAALIPEEETVDKILSLGFLGPDNIKNFAGYLPELEKTNSKLADLLFASRCGLSTVPEEAVESAMRNTDQIISGLRSLQEQKEP